MKGSGSERRYLRPRGIAAATKTASAPTETVWALSSSIWADRQKEGQCKAFFAAEKFIGKCFIVRLLDASMLRWQLYIIDESRSACNVRTLKPS